MHVKNYNFNILPVGESLREPVEVFPGACWDSLCGPVGTLPASLLGLSLRACLGAVINRTWYEFFIPCLIK